MKSYFFLHGFLGSEKDWQLLKNQIHQKSELDPIHVCEILNRKSLQNLSSYESLIHSLRADRPQRGGVFVGYSLGGRIGLNWLRLFPQDFQHWVFISTHPGLQTEQERMSRAQNDQNWIEQLEKLELIDFIKEWNSQSVFDSTNMIQTELLDFDPVRLRACFQNLSLSTQLDHRDVIRTNRDRITWIVGERDQKFYKIAQDLKKNLVIDKLISLEAGHRVHIDQPAQMAKIISKL